MPILLGLSDGIGCQRQSQHSALGPAVSRLAGRFDARHFGVTPSQPCVVACREDKSAVAAAANRRRRISLTAFRFPLPSDPSARPSPAQLPRRPRPSGERLSNWRPLTPAPAHTTWRWLIWPLPGIMPLLATEDPTATRDAGMFSAVDLGGDRGDFRGRERWSVQWVCYGRISIRCPYRQLLVTASCLHRSRHGSHWQPSWSASRF